VIAIEKDVPIEIEIEVVEAGQPRPQRPGPEPFGVARLRPFPGVIVRSAEPVPRGKGRTGAKAGIASLSGPVPANRKYTLPPVRAIH
jgi:hypothetical protein